MRLLTLLGIVILLCSAGAAQCVSYFPNSATFPFPLAPAGWSSVRMAPCMLPKPGAKSAIQTADSECLLRDITRQDKQDKKGHLLLPTRSKGDSS